MTIIIPIWPNGKDPLPFGTALVYTYKNFQAITGDNAELLSEFSQPVLRLPYNNTILVVSQYKLVSH